MLSKKRNILYNFILSNCVKKVKVWLNRWENRNGKSWKFQDENGKKANLKSFSFILFYLDVGCILTMAGKIKFFWLNICSNIYT